MDNKLREAKKTRKQLQNAFTHIISDQLFAKAWSFIKSLWNSFQDSLNEFIAKHFPQKALYIKRSLDTFFHKVFFDLLGPVIHFLSYPLIQLAKFIAETLQINRKADDIIENLHSDAVEHLLYKWIDILLDNLLILKTNKDKLNAATSTGS